MRRLEFSDPTWSPSTVIIADAPVPSPRPGNLTIRVEAVGINFIDEMARKGTPGYATSWPWVGGLEVVGIVHEVAADVLDVSPGSRAAAFTFGGGFADVVEVSAALVTKVPESVDPLQAAAIPLTGVTAALLSDLAMPGDQVLMHSASGGLGAFVASMLRQQGVSAAIGTVGRPTSVDQALDAGWSDVAVRSSGWLPRMKDSGVAVNVILDPVGVGIGEQLDLLAPGGRLVIMGNASERQLVLPEASELILRNVSITGFSVRGVARSRPKRIRAAMADCLLLIAEGSIRPAVQSVAGLAGIPDALAALAAGVGVGKYAVDLR